MIGSNVLEARAILLIVSSNPISAHLWGRPCGVAWDAVPEPMVEYINPDFGFY
jgi:hypothetical protein